MKIVLIGALGKCYCDQVSSTSLTDKASVEYIGASVECHDDQVKKHKGIG
jgi:hypothetical protein